MKKIFISYRRDDSGDVTGRITDRLRQQFGEESIFTDVDSIPLGVDFREHLDREVGRCDIFLAIVGRQWATMTDDTGTRRLDDPSDFVRIEVESALQRKIPVVPLLAHGISMPSAEELPDSLSELAFRNGLPVRRDPDFHTDMDRVIDGIEKHFSQNEREKEKSSAAEQAKQQLAVEQKKKIEADAEEQRRNDDAEKQLEASTVEQTQPPSPSGSQIELSKTTSSTSSKTYAVAAVLVLTIAAGGWWFSQSTGSDPQLPEKQAEITVKEKPEADVKDNQKAEAEAKRLAEAKQKAAAEAKLKTEVEAKQKAELEAKRSAEAKQKAAAEAKLKTEVEAKQKVEAEAKRLVEVKQKAAAEAKLKTEVEAKQKAEAEAKRLAEAKQKAEVKSNIATNAPFGTLFSKKETRALVSGKTVFWKKGNGAYYSPGGKLYIKWEGKTEDGHWTVTDKGAVCWHVPTWDTECESYFFTSNGLMDEEGPADEFREGNHLDALY